MTTTTTNRLDEIRARARLAMDRNTEARWIHSWLLGPGRDRADRYSDSTRLSAEQSMWARGWTIDQLDAYACSGTKPQPIPLKKAQEDESAAGGWGWSSEVQLAVDANEAVLRALARSWAPQRRGPEIWRGMDETQRDRFRRWMPKMAADWEAGISTEDDGAVVAEATSMLDRVADRMRGPVAAAVLALVVTCAGFISGAMWRATHPASAKPVLAAVEQTVEAAERAVLLVTVPSHPDRALYLAARAQPALIQAAR